MIIWRDQPLANDHLSAPSPQSPLPGSRFNLANLCRTIFSCFMSDGWKALTPAHGLKHSSVVLLDSQSIIMRASLKNDWIILIQKLSAIFHSGERGKNDFLLRGYMGAEQTAFPFLIHSTPPHSHGSINSHKRTAICISTKGPTHKVHHSKLWKQLKVVFEHNFRLRFRHSSRWSFFVKKNNEGH